MSNIFLNVILQDPSFVRESDESGNLLLILSSELKSSGEKQMLISFQTEHLIWPLLPTRQCSMLEIAKTNVQQILTPEMYFQTLASVK